MAIASKCTQCGKVFFHYSYKELQRIIRKHKHKQFSFAYVPKETVDALFSVSQRDYERIRKMFELNFELIPLNP